MNIRELVRSITIVFDDKDKVHGFLQANILADKASIHSLIGSKIMRHLTKENFNKIFEKHQIKEVEFVMEDKVLNAFKLIWPDLTIGRKCVIDGKDATWITLKI